MRRFSAIDLPEVQGWYALRHLAPPTLDMLPDFGCIEPEVAAGWLYCTDSSFALLDGYITNPEAFSRDRDAALDVITSELLAEARRAGFRHVLAYTRHGSIGRRAMRHGFRGLGDRAMYGRGI